MRVRLFIIAAVVAAGFGCNGLSLKKADGGSTCAALRAAIGWEIPSTAATAYLEKHGWDSRTATEQLVEDTTAEGRLVLAELCDIAGRESEFWSNARSSERYLDAAFHASKALFEQSDDLPAARRADAERIYNHAVERFLRRTAGRKLMPDYDWEEKLASRGARVRVRRDETVWSPEPFDEFQFADDYIALGVPSRKTEGLGVPLFAVKKRGWRDPEREKGPERFFPPQQAYPATAILRFAPVSGLGRPPALLELHDPIRYDAVSLGRRAAVLASDTTTPLVYQVTRSDLDKFTYLGLFDPSSEQHKTGLYMSHPYERGKIPVVLIHGLWSSPKTWTRTINDLRADPTLRERYQFWVFQYPTGNPFIHSASILRQQIAELRATFDPDHTDPAFDQMMLVGHSMGGLVAKSLIAFSGDAVWKLISDRPFEELKADAEQKELFARAFFFQPVPEIKRVVFICTPHKGSQIGSDWIGQIGDRLIRRPNLLVQVHDAVLKQNGSNFFSQAFIDGVPSSIKTLRSHSPMLLAVDKMPITPGLPRHSIIAQLMPAPAAISTDGVVPFDSSHFEGVVSEKIVTGAHTCLDEPEVIEELRRILFLHLGEPATSDK